MVEKQASASELKVLNILLKSNQALSVRQISELLEKSEDIHWAHKTISTFLKRMERKGLVNYEKRGLTYYYFPIIKQQKFFKKEATKLLHNYFQGSIKNFLSAFGENEISKEELEDIKNWVEHLNDK